MKDGIAIVFGMRIGLKNNRTKSSCFRMMHHVLSPVMEYLVMQPRKTLIRVLESAMQIYGIPKQVMTDHETQFTSLSRETCKDPKPNEFQQFLKGWKIHHIKSRVKHPQSNGKVERVILTLKQLWNHFRCWDAAILYYNYERPHSSLEKGCLRTPHQAFQDKIRK